VQRLATVRDKVSQFCERNVYVQTHKANMGRDSNDTNNRICPALGHPRSFSSASVLQTLALYRGICVMFCLPLCPYLTGQVGSEIANHTKKFVRYSRFSALSTLLCWRSQRSQTNSILLTSRTRVEKHTRNSAWRLEKFESWFVIALPYPPSPRGG